MKLIDSPHHYRRQSIHAVLLCLIVIIALLAASCAVSRKPKDPCKERRGMSGYGYGWLKCRETKKVFILDSQGAVICTFVDKKNILHFKE